MAAATQTRPDVRISIAIAIGLTAIFAVRGGGFYTPDLVVVPVLLAVIACTRVRDAFRSDLLVGGALITFAVYWHWRGLADGIPSRSVSLAAAAMAFGATYLIARDLRSALERLIVTRVLVIAATGVAIVSLVLWSAHRPPWGLPFDGVWRLSGPFAYPNAAGLFFALGFLANLGQDSRPWGERVVAGGVLIAALIATASRGAFLALGLGLLVVGPGALATASVARRRVLAIGAAVAGLAALYVALLTFGFVGNAGARSSTASADDRVAEWSAASRAGTEHLVFGNGPEQDLRIHNFRGDAIARYAHNEVLQIFAGGGLVGIALLAGSVGAIAVTQTGQLRPRGRLSTAVLVAFAVGGLLDFSWHFAGLAAYAGWLAGLDEADLIGDDPV